MKKIPLLFFCVIFLFCGCSREPEPPEKSFSSKISASLNGIKIKADITSNSSDFITVKLKSPKCLNGYTYSYKDGNFKISYKNFRIKANGNYIPNTSFPQIIYNVIRSMKIEDNCVYQGKYNSLAKFRGRCDSGKYTLTTDFSTGLIKEISIKENKFDAKFTNTKPIN